MPDDLTRLDLANGYLDGALSAAERVELDRRLGEDSRAAERFGALLDLDAALLAELGEPDVEDRVLAGIAARHARATSSRVLGAIRLRDVRGAGATHTRGPIAGPAAGRRYGWRLTALAASGLVALGGILFYESSRLGGRFGAPPGATLVQVAGEVRHAAGGRERAAREGDAVRPGHTIATAGSGSAATLDYADHCRFELAARTRVTLAVAEPDAARRVFVEAGAIVARVPPAVGAEAPTVLTPHAEVHVQGTVFGITVLADSSRIDVEQGRVQVVNRQNGQVRGVTAGFSALVGAETVVVATGPREGAAAAWASRARDGLQVLYTFEDGRGTRVRDVAGVGTPLDLTIEDETAVEWPPGGGLLVRRPTLVASDRPARELVEACRASNELTVEAWFVSLDSRQTGVARIVTLSSGPAERNFTIGVCHFVPGYPIDWGWAYSARLTTTSRMFEILSEPDILDTSLTHLVVTHTAAGEVTLYVNGANVTGTSLRSPAQETDVGSLLIDGTFADWDDGWRLALANEFQSESAHARPWLGEYRLVAVYSRALTGQEVRANFGAGSSRPAPAASADAGR